MKLNLCVLLAFLSASVSVRALAQQQEKMPDIYQQAEMEADRLQKLLDLEDWQTFYVDSTLKHDFPAMMAEYEADKRMGYRKVPRIYPADSTHISESGQHERASAHHRRNNIWRTP